MIRTSGWGRFVFVGMLQLRKFNQPLFTVSRDGVPSTIIFFEWNSLVIDEDNDNDDDDEDDDDDNDEELVPPSSLAISYAALSKRSM